MYVCLYIILILIVKLCCFCCYENIKYSIHNARCADSKLIQRKILRNLIAFRYLFIIKQQNRIYIHNMKQLAFVFCVLTFSLIIMLITKKTEISLIKRRINVLNNVVWMHSCINNNDGKKIVFRFCANRQSFVHYFGGFIVEFWIHFEVFHYYCHKDDLNVTTYGRQGLVMSPC